MAFEKPSEVIFINKDVEKEFLSLDDSGEIKKFIKRAIEDIKLNAFCGIPIPKRLIPKLYIQDYDVKNLWKYDLPDGWRLIYTINSDKVKLLSIILEWFDHKEYERRFNY